MSYRALITTFAPGHDARHIEAWMRSEHGTLDALSQKEFAEEIQVAKACIASVGPVVSEALAQSFGL